MKTIAILIAKWGTVLYIAQAAAGVAVGFGYGVASGLGLI